MNNEVPRNTDVFRNLRTTAPTELLDFLNQVLLLFPDEFSYRVRQVIETLPEEGDNLQRVLEVVRAQWKHLQSDDWVEIAVVGPAQTGKASLVSTIRQQQDEPEESIFAVFETPGLEEFLGYETVQAVPKELERSDVILVVLDARYGIAESTVRMVDRLRRLGKPVIVVLNKSDLVDKISPVLAEARDKLGGKALAVSAYEPGTINSLLRAVSSSYPKSLYPLTKAFPGFRRAICKGVATQAGVAAGLVGAIPIPVSDLLPLTAIQTAMILRIARAFGCELSRDRARELIPMLAAGALVRQATHGLRKRFPRHGKLIGVSVAGLWTYGLGRAAVAYFEGVTAVVNGREIESSRLHAIPTDNS